MPNILRFEVMVIPTAILMLFLLSSHGVTSASMDDTKRLISSLLWNHNINVRPVVNQSHAVDVHAGLELQSIQTVDEVSSKFSFVAAIVLFWRDEGMTWNASDYGGLTYITLSYQYVWVPEIILLNPSEESDTLGRHWQRVRYQQNGQAVWVPGGLMNTHCDIDVFKYPFDQQVCNVRFGVSGFYFSEVALYAFMQKIDTSILVENSAWTVEDTHIQNYITAGDVSAIQFSFHLRRKSAFIIINVVLPTTLLGYLNVLVFLLLPVSGDRVSFCITMLLSIMVFMTIVNDTLPKTSEPVPAISYALMMNVALSAAIMFMTILNMRLFNKDQTEVPKWLQTLYMKLRCRCSRQTMADKGAVDSTELGNEVNLPNGRNDVLEAKQIEIINLPSDHGQHEEQKNTENECNLTKISQNNNISRDSTCADVDCANVTWQMISSMLDYVLLAVFVVVESVIFVGFLFITLT